MEALSDDDEVSTGRPDLQIRLNLSSGPAEKPQAKPLAPSNRDGHSVMPGEAMQQTFTPLRLLDARMRLANAAQHCIVVKHQRALLHAGPFQQFCLADSAPPKQQVISATVPGCCCMDFFCAWYCPTLHLAIKSCDVSPTCPALPCSQIPLLQLHQSRPGSGSAWSN